MGTYPAKQHLSKDADFARAFADGFRMALPHFLVRAIKNGLPYPRLGFRVGKKTGNAPHRNRVRRLIRELFRNCQSFPKEGYDLIFAARGDWKELKCQDLTPEFETIVGRLGKRPGEKR